MGNVVVYRIQGSDLERLPIEADTLDEATLKTAHGTYTVFRLYSGRRVLRLDRHLARMRRSAEALGMPYPHSDVWLRDVVRRAVEESGIDIPRVRLTVPFSAPDAALVALEPFSPPPPEVYAHGVRVGLAHDTRERPDVKDSRFIEKRVALQSDMAAVYEIMLTDEQGRILEGTGSNFYAVLGGELRTAGEGMLEGVARSILLQIAPRVLPVVLEPVTVSDLPRLDEAMLTSASRGIVPVVEVGGVTIGSGLPGPFTARLGAAYDAQVEAELEPL